MSISCFKISDAGICPKCKGKNLAKNGFTKNGKQQFVCKTCNRRFIDYYTYKAYQPNLNHQIVVLTKEGLGIRSTPAGARLHSVPRKLSDSDLISIFKNHTIQSCLPTGRTCGSGASSLIL